MNIDDNIPLICTLQKEYENSCLAFIFCRIYISRPDIWKVCMFLNHNDGFEVLNV